MRILFLTQLFEPASLGGGEALFSEWAKALTKKGHKVVVITQRIKGTLAYEKLNNIEIVRAGPPIQYTARLPPGILANLAYFIFTISETIKYTRTHEVDIIHSNTYIPAFVGIIISKVVGKPQVVSIFDVYFSCLPNFWSIWSDQKGISCFSAPLGLLLEKLILRFAPKFVHTISDTTKHDLISAGISSEIFVVPLAISSNSFNLCTQNALDIADPYIIFVGRLVFYKNLHTIIRAFRSVVDSVPNAKLVIVGDGPLRNQLENLARDLGLYDHVIFKGRVDHLSKVRLIHNASCLVFPGLIEGFGMTAIEAFACGKAVLASNVPPSNQMFRPGIDSFLVEPYDITGWCERMVFMLKNPNVSSRMGQSARLRARSDFEMSLTISQHEEMYRRILVVNGKR